MTWPPRPTGQGSPSSCTTSILARSLPTSPRCGGRFEAGARSVVVAHLYGVPADLAAVQALAAEFGAILIEDAAQGSGCEWRGGRQAPTAPSGC